MTKKTKAKDKPVPLVSDHPAFKQFTKALETLEANGLMVEIKPNYKLIVTTIKDNK
jgi:hypothetical protein